MIKDLLVYLDGHKEDEVRLAYAEQVAVQHQAFLTGLYCNIVPEMMIAGDPGMTAGQVIVDMQNAAISAGAEVEEKLKKRFAKLAVGNELRRVDVFASQARNVVAAEARRADLFIATRPYDQPAANPELMEAVLFNSGRGCLFVPPEIMPQGDIDTVLVAWRNTREAARALSEAIPVLQAAKKVIVGIVVEDGPPEEEGEMPGADIARHLDRHGIGVELRHITGWSNPSEAILNEVEKSGAQMIVMGGYGHSRFREWVLGGVTRDILKVAKVPVLMAH